MSRSVILVPQRSDGGWRDQLWDFAKAHWSQLGFDIVEGDPPAGPFNRSAGINRASDLAGNWDTAIVIDGDVVVNLDRVRDAITLAHEMERMVFPFRVRQCLNHGMTSRILSGHKGAWTSGITSSFHDNLSSCFVIPRSVWDRVGGFDERFVGWGWEDVAFKISVDTTSGNGLRLPGDLWHLWHHKNPENNHASPLFIANRDLCHRYIERRHSVKLMDEILQEEGGPLL